MEGHRNSTAHPPADAPGAPGPLVTVILPVYNRVQFLDQAIQSVLGQTHRHLQLIVVDDGSTVDLRPVLAKYGAAVEFHRQANGGPSAARNYGMKWARGEFVLFLDDDDYLEPTAVATLLQTLEGHPGAVWAGGVLAYANEQGARLDMAHPARYESGDVYAGMIGCNLIGTPSVVLLRPGAVRSCGGFDEQFRFCEDYDLWLTLARDYPIAATSATVSNYRYHLENATRNWARLYTSWLAVLEKHRRRARPGFDDQFQKTIARVHLNFGDELYVHGRHFEARQQWVQGARADPQLRRRLVLRYSKSYLPPVMLDTLRGVQKRIVGFFNRGSVGNVAD